MRPPTSQPEEPGALNRPAQDLFMLFTRYNAEVVAIKIHNPVAVQLLERYGPVCSPHKWLRAELCEQAFDLLLRIRKWIGLF